MMKNYAEKYAKLFKLDPKAENESGTEFRIRVAKALEATEDVSNVYAHEALENRKMSGDPFAYGSLNRGYSDSRINEVAAAVEAEFQKEIVQLQRSQRSCAWRIFYKLLRQKSAFS